MSNVTPEQFVKTFIAAIKGKHDPQWVADKLGMDRTAVNSRASRYRKLGIQLPYFERRAPGKIDIQGINRELLGIK